MKAKKKKARPASAAVPESAGRLPKRVRTGKALAKLIRERFGIPCDKMKINNWQNRRTPPFPSPGENNEYEVQPCLEWVQKNVKAAKRVDAGARQPTRGGACAPRDVETDPEKVDLELLDRRAEIARLNNRIVEEEAARFDLEKKKGRHIERDAAEHTTRSVARTLAKFFQQEIETTGPAQRREMLKTLLLAHGQGKLTAEESDHVLGAFFLWDVEQGRAMQDRIERKCELEAAGDIGQNETDEKAAKQ
jgi:hypothetical protein